MENKFKFVMPAELEKSDDGEWRIAGLASTQSLDQQGETIMQKGIDLTPIDQKRGILNWDHQKGVENTIGLLDGYNRNEKGLFIKGRLFKNHSKAIAVKQILDSLGDEDKGRIGLSVEGQILERDPKNTKIIKKCRINAVALTMNPVNAETYADLVKSMNSAEDIEIDSTEDHFTSENNEQATFTADQVMQIVKKALGVGEGYTQAPNKLSDGDAMATSDMKAKKKKKKDGDSDKAEKGDNPCWEGYERTPGTKKYEEGSCRKKTMKKMKKSLYKSNMLTMLNTLQELYPGYSREDIWSAIKNRMETTFPDINEEYPEN